MSRVVFCLMGPTASGKTDLACELIQHFPCEIISVDSAMIYRGMDIGTAKPDAQTLARAPHRLINILNPNETYSAAQFCDDAHQLCDEMISRGKIPLLVGGTMMYFRALQQGLSTLPEANADIRQQLLQDINTHGLAQMHARLTQIDPIAATRIHAHDAQRIQRALEVHAITGHSLSSFLQQTTQPPAYKFVNIILNPSSRAWLHARIEMRFAQMLMEGFIDEVVEVLARWSLTNAHPAMRCVGYRQVCDYLNGDYDLAALQARGSAATRQLAKRQLTWLRNWPTGDYFEAENQDTIKAIRLMMAAVLDGAFPALG